MTTSIPDPDLIDAFSRDGFAVVRSLFDRHEVDRLRNHFMDIRAAGSYREDMAGVDADDADPLTRYPRMIHMHRWDEVAWNWMLDPRLAACMRAFFNEEPLLASTMLYFKPAGSRGQALHQDQHFLRAAPGSCGAAWMALDPCDEANGCMQVVPGSHTLPLLCTERADTTTSFTDIAVPVPSGMHSVPVIMEPGDVLFFQGLLIHGSLPNTTQDRFRRTLIAHYITASAEKVADYYHPIIAMDGTPVEYVDSAPGGPCGRWVDINGKQIVEVGPR